ncbi:Alpha/Beta hydrolase protein [Xylariomycetidae sp. FL2044]|nr:Alpha/Beta hydrolase protein [Xylariomycetidae sp. FL2044]
MRSIQLSSVVLGVTSLVLGKTCGSGASLQVVTNSGTAHGTINETSPNVRQFLGISYAQPPVAQLRFQPPVKYTSNETFNAMSFAPSCMQPISTPEALESSIYQQYLPELNLGSSDQSEDCLFLNVYAPLKPAAEKLPVFIWIHGGGFTSNGANVPYQIPDQWIERKQELVVVTINYRLNVFGFPNAAGQPLNVGLLDQRLAVEWARDNIKAFGGDPERMVLWGQSAGAWSVNYYGYAYPDDPIVAGLIADSGGSDAFSSGDPSNFSAVAEQAGCGGGLDAGSELACMQNIDTATIQGLASNTTGASFGPGPDNVTVFTNNTERALEGLVAKLPAIIGTNSREGSGFVSWDPENPEASPAEGDIEEATKIIVCPTVAEIQNRAVGGLTTYRYHYSGNFSNISPLPWIGAIHSGELPLLFGTHWQYRGNSTEFEWEVSYAMQDLWLSFAKDVSQDPASESFSWPKYDDAEGQTMMASFAENQTTVVALAAGDIVDGLCTESL